MSPSDSTRFEPLTEGLEVSVVAKRDWLIDNGFARLDSEYQIKRFREAIEQVRRAPARQLLDAPLAIIHPHELKREFSNEGGTWFLRTQNVRPMRIDRGNIVCLPREVADTLKRNVIRMDDILITRTGANRGDCALFDSDQRAVASSHTFIVRSDGWQHPYLMTFLNSSFGKAQIDKGAYGAAQPELAPYYLQRIWVPCASDELQARIGDLIKSARIASRSSAQSLADGEKTLLEALGLNEWFPPEPLTYTRSAFDVFADGRLDAQFHAPAVGALREELACRFELVELGNLGDVTNGRAVQYDPDGEVPIIRSGDVGKNHSAGELLRASRSEPIFYLRKDDVLVSSIGFGSIGRIEPMSTDSELGTVSEVSVIRQSSLDPYYLTAFLRSLAGQRQLNRLITGATGQLHLYPRDIRGIFVPLVSEELQLKLRQKAQRADMLRLQSEGLLTTAKRAVEIAVEDSEQSALRYTESNMEAQNTAIRE